MDLKLLKCFTDQYKKSQGRWFNHKWDYANACILESYLNLYKVTDNSEHLYFVSEYVQNLFDDDGRPIGLNLDQYNIDQIKMAKVLLDLNEISPDNKYSTVANDIYKQLQSYPRTKEGNFWHKEFYISQVWLDGLYMGQPFYTKYLKDFRGQKKFDDTVRQFENCRKRLYDESLKLYLHAYDESREIFWADKQTGRSPSVWLRAIGWFVMAFVDVIEIISEDRKGVETLTALFSETVEGLMQYRHESGMWYQVVDQGGREHNYLETSGSAMIAYALMKAYRLGIASKEAAFAGVGTIEGIMNKYIREEKGEILLGGICRSAGLGTHPALGYKRDGTFNYYTTEEKIVENNGHGTAPLFMAYAEYLILTAAKLI